ncbi:enoyl-CoA delta isomerase 1, mitochondrial [Diachasma alloeum]|uniref:enoyl-CoA delta isomerase 1, mitochondrial n=1 Tax=Diachasma alloeum TaxID=454923 RepID=UPI00073834F4|nr:enoyl-CoA delta isomerase 1, mitochondrial [Diachasma alloeum]XP_015116528.1 enoyl-CoA delta isomerase 1, mitochondrial [Diachasma alloeum]XP_015116529.1 enoyl-CoA delta isomerase 1, mitochondrial [Diachasma alloeum]XP_015116531.1 enoyl-CoA delta isomerase 1, mitochondrial [Diachasma alloeum]XP_015116532.1 enoyl-CoA delta isomerase 1, mitochondrial [Diachasma alloeum]XP_015116533.1 enoyl-CoA delta isomerase 1, mitochondrial [Diachasma alloeum]XP_015116534.1 enoyl-CoA delta isomerase 1, mit
MNIPSVRKAIRLADWRILSRLYSSNSKFLDVTQNEKTGVSTISLNRAPVNSLNLDILRELKESLEKLKKDGSKGLILTSSLPTVFSGGLDIMEMYKPDIKRCTEFWNTLQDTWILLNELEIPTVAAINGASPAGGCLLAISCEYRIFVDGKHTIGLNETKLGIVAPFWFQEPYIKTIGQRRAELALLRGDLFTPQQALEIGLVDELASSKEDALAKAEKYIESYRQISPRARAMTKKSLRESMIQNLVKNRETDTVVFISAITNPGIQTSLGLYIESLKKKAK